MKTLKYFLKQKLKELFEIITFKNSHYIGAPDSVIVAIRAVIVIPIIFFIISYMTKVTLKMFPGFFGNTPEIIVGLFLMVTTALAIITTIGVWIAIYKLICDFIYWIIENWEIAKNKANNEMKDK